MGDTTMTPIITIKGRYLWKGPHRFIIHGAVLQTRQDRHDGHERPVANDPLADDGFDVIDQMIPLFQELKFNTLFVYTIDPTKSHDKVMQRLAEAGIYVLACLSSHHPHVVNRTAPLTSYNRTLLSHYFRVIDCLSAYPNTLGIITSNEVINTIPSFVAAPVLRALNRDVKRYMSLTREITGQRVLPVGVSVSDNRVLVDKQFEYLASGDEGEAVDFFSFNNYAWAGKSSMQMSGYSNLAEYWDRTLRTGYNLPVFFSEYGTNVISPRLFRETKAMLTEPEMTAVFSGGCVYEFVEGSNQHGLVRLGRGDEEENQGNMNGNRRILEKLEDYEAMRKVVNEEIGSVGTGDGVRTDLIEDRTDRPKMQTVEEMWKPEITGGGLPECPVDWKEVRERLEDGEWVDARGEWEQIQMDDLAERFDEGLRLEGVDLNG